MKREKMNEIKDHFQEEAKEFDGIIQRLIPYYDEMIEALISAIPFERDRPIEVIDLGCGTGTILKKVKENYPNARLSAVDISENMIEMTKGKLSDYSDVTYHIHDFYEMEFSKKYDVILSSLALHHLITDEDKISFYGEIFKNLNNGGVFYNADVVLGSNDKLQDIYMKKWIEFMNKNCAMEEIEEKWLKKYKKEDRPAKLMDQLKWLEEIGFNNIDVIWKYYNYAVYGAKKK